MIEHGIGVIILISILIRAYQLSKGDFNDRNRT